MGATAQFQGGLRARTLVDALASAAGPELLLGGARLDLGLALREWAVERAARALAACDGAKLDVPPQTRTWLGWARENLRTPGLRREEGQGWWMGRGAVRPAQDDAWTLAEAGAAAYESARAALAATDPSRATRLAAAASHAALQAAVAERTALGYGWSRESTLVVLLGAAQDLQEKALRERARALGGPAPLAVAACSATGVPERPEDAVRRDGLLEHGHVDWLTPERCPRCDQWAPATAGGLCEECLRLQIATSPEGLEAPEVLGPAGGPPPPHVLYCEGRETRQSPGSERWGVVGLRLEPERTGQSVLVRGAVAREADGTASGDDYTPVIAQGLSAELERHRQAGGVPWPLRLTVLRLEVHPVDSRPSAFATAAARALRLGLATLASRNVR